MTDKTGDHCPVMLGEVMEALNIKPAGIYVDATFGRGGHAAAILQQLGDQGRLLAMDRDPEAVKVARQRFADEPRFEIEQGPFAGLYDVLAGQGLLGRIDGLLLDLGVSSPQLDDAGRGFSFRQNGPLDMRMDPTTGISAAEWLAHASEAEIVTVLRDFGEERYARRIARAIVAARQQAPIESTAQLAAIVAAANPAWEKGKDPATRSFQALRIHINHELEQLQQCLAHVVEMLAVGGRLAVISFHSLEDRMVKRFIRRLSQGEAIPRGLPVTGEQQNIRLRRIGRAQHASQLEVADNPRARSAVLRVAEKAQ
jgi:16S rRNA (cytosine1402-N4)-methyltransferase